MTFSGEQAVDTRDDASTPDVFVARQPIMRADSTVVGYELLYRSIAEPDLVIQNPRAATGHVLATPLFSIGLDRLVGDARAWINFPRSWLVEGVIGALPANRVVLEVLESVPVDDELVATCRLLREQGFTLALDGYMPNDPRYPLLPIVDYAKVDLGIVETAQWPSMIHLLRANHTIPIALKVEDWLHLDRALNNGFELFQGYYLTRPNIVPGKEVPVLDSTRLLALKVAASEESTLEDVEHIVETDAGLAFRLLRYLNAAAFGFRDPVSTVHQAVVRLGDHGARTWLLIATIHALGKGRPLELMPRPLTFAAFRTSSDTARGVLVLAARPSAPTSCVLARGASASL